MRRGRISAASRYLPQLQRGRKVPTRGPRSSQRAKYLSAASRSRNHETHLLWRNNLPGVCVNTFGLRGSGILGTRNFRLSRSDKSPFCRMKALVAERIAFSPGYLHLNYLYSKKNGPVYKTGPSRGGSRRSSMLFNGRSSEMFHRRRLSCGY